MREAWSSGSCNFPRGLDTRQTTDTGQQSSKVISSSLLKIDFLISFSRGKLRSQPTSLPQRSAVRAPKVKRLWKLFSGSTNGFTLFGINNVSHTSIQRRLNLLSKVSIGKKSLKRSIVTPIKLHNGAGGAGVGKASGGIKKELPNHLGNSSLCLSLCLVCVSSGALKLIKTFHNAFYGRIFRRAVVKAVEEGRRQLQKLSKLTIKP